MRQSKLCLVWMILLLMIVKLALASPSAPQTAIHPAEGRLEHFRPGFSFRPHSLCSSRSRQASQPQRSERNTAQCVLRAALEHAAPKRGSTHGMACASASLGGRQHFRPTQADASAQLRESVQSRALVLQVQHHGLKLLAGTQSPHVAGQLCVLAPIFP